MKKKDRKRLRALDREKNVKVGTHEFWVKTTKPEIRNAIMRIAKKGTGK
jgi:hypothetical protein